MFLHLLVFGKIDGCCKIIKNSQTYLSDGQPRESGVAHKYSRNDHESSSKNL